MIASLTVILEIAEESMSITFIESLASYWKIMGPVGPLLGIKNAIEPVQNRNI